MATHSIPADRYQVVFVSTPSIGNLVPTIEFAHHLTHRDPRFSASVLVITLQQRTIVSAYIQSRSTSVTHHLINFIYLPTVDPPTPDQYQSSLGYVSLFLDKQKPNVNHAISNLMSAAPAAPVAGLFVDMFTTSFIDVAKQLGIPCYLFFASPASFLGFMLHLPALDTQLASDFEIDSSGTGLIVPKDPASELIIPSFESPLPPSMLPNSVLKRNRDGYSCYLNHARRYRETTGIAVNTFLELEPHAIDSLRARGSPPVYPVGPILDHSGAAQWHPDRAQHEVVMKWLDDQPPSSVVFLCFGSMGSLEGPQLREIAKGLELSGCRFLWSIREPPKSELHLPGEYTNGSVERVLPQGFLDRTAGFGLVCGWVSQVSILAHQAIGGFVSHCGWNSILESVWHGVPIATWPLYAEQQMNAFQMVKDLRLAVEIRLDYRMGEEGSALVLADELERGLRRLMEGDDEVRTRVKEMKTKSRAALEINIGSSYKSLGSLIHKITSLVSSSVVNA